MFTSKPVVITCIILFIVVFVFLFFYLKSRWHGIDVSRDVVYEYLTVADRDTFAYDSEGDKLWHSQIVRGELHRMKDGTFLLKDEREYLPLVGNLVEGVKKKQARGMELSELKRFNNKLYTCCDRTGIIYELLFEDRVTPLLFPRYIINTGDGKTRVKGLKCEWITEHQGSMIVGSTGKEYTTRDGVYLHDDTMFVTRISKTGEMVHENWKEHYLRIRKALGEKILDPGYVVHEAVEYNQFTREWFFLPRRISEELYDDTREGEMGANKIIKLNYKLEKPKIIDVKSDSPNTHGFSSITFVPGHPDEIVALKTAEGFENNSVETYITVMKVTGEVLLQESLLASDKLEGIELYEKVE